MKNTSFLILLLFAGVAKAEQRGKVQTLEYQMTKEEFTDLLNDAERQAEPKPSPQVIEPKPEELYVIRESRSLKIANLIYNPSGSFVVYDVNGKTIFKIDSDGDIFLRRKWVGKDTRLKRLLDRP